MVRLGIEQLLVDPPASLKGRRLGLLCNQASVDSRFRHSRDLIHAAFPGQLCCLFSPQHGFFAEKQDNMQESGDAVDPNLKVPIFSLYGDTRRPDRTMFDHLDVLLVDLVDVGTRVYTFLYTLAYCMEAAAAYGKKILVLDRPNPLGGQATEGNILRDDFRSFVGLYPLPMRHGLTLGELALLLNDRFHIGAELEIMPMQGWHRSMLFPQTGLEWVFPSPNMPSFAAALVYPGQVIWEGTNISEGRGTTLPFELFGAPFFVPDEITERLRSIDLPGCILRPLLFEPTANKWAGRTCAGFQLHVTEPVRFLPYRTSLALLQAVLTLYPDRFAYKEPPYEYEYERLPMDLILGDGELREALERGAPIPELEETWQPPLQEFDDLRHRYFLYQA